MHPGIILEGERSPLVTELAARLRELGLSRESPGDTLTEPLLDALNAYRRANNLIELDFADPTALRMLGIECTGDEIMLLAHYAADAPTEIACYDACREIVEESRSLGLSIGEVILRRGGVRPGALSTAQITAAILAALS